MRDKGLVMAFQQQVVTQTKALIGALKVAYWLAKEELAYTTKYELLLNLTQSIGCTYVPERSLLWWKYQLNKPSDCWKFFAVTDTNIQHFRESTAQIC